MSRVLLAVALAACGGTDGGTGTERAARAATPAAADLPAEVTFGEHVAPILFRHCGHCHRPGQMAPFSLVDYEEAAARADRIAAAAESGYMPPWLPDSEPGVFVGDRSLSEREIAILRRWAKSGAPRGDPALLPPRPAGPEGWELGEPDLVISMDGTYEVPADGSDIYRNFVLPVSVEWARYVRAVALRPGDRRVAHHGVLLVDSTSSSRRMDAQDPGPGYHGLGPMSQAHSPAGFFIGWTPGARPFEAPDGMAWWIRPGTDLVLQLHLRPAGVPAAVRPEVGLYFADGPPTRAPAVLRLGSETLDIPAGDPAYVVEDSFRLAAPVSVLAIYPHAHFLAREIRAWAELPNGARRPLLHIPDWDFNWQDGYRYRQAIPLPAGTVLRTRFVYDNSAGNPQNPNRPPERVRFGHRSVDEMCELALQVLPGRPVDLASLRRDFAVKTMRIQLEGLRARLARDPSDARAHMHLGALLAAAGASGEAIEHYRAALRQGAREASLHYNLALALQARGGPGDAEEAVAQYREALRLRPDYAAAHHNLAVALADAGRRRQALPHYRAALRSDEDLTAARLGLAEALRLEGAAGEAIRHYRRVVEAEPANGRAHYGLALALGSAANPARALEHLRAAAAAEPEWAAPQVALAELLATHPDPRVRDPEAAVAAGRRGAELTGYGNPVALDALAAAYAAAGQREAAVAAASRAVELAAAAGQAELAESIRRRLASYRRGGS